MNMSVMQWAEQFLYIVSSVLYYPVMLGLVGLVFYMMVLLGGLFREMLDRRRGQQAAVIRYRERLTRLLSQADVEHRSLEVERLLQESENELNIALERARFVVRAGPGLGLMGTLIPMGVSLAALAQGSMPEMAQHMVTAFTAAVVGLGSGVAAFAIALVREHWMRFDVIQMRYLTEGALDDGVVSTQLLKVNAASSVKLAEDTV
jgi:biopolymer transport protein ExbB/TolQ